MTGGVIDKFGYLILNSMLNVVCKLFVLSFSCCSSYFRVLVIQPPIFLQKHRLPLPFLVQLIVTVGASPIFLSCISVWVLGKPLLLFFSLICSKPIVFFCIGCMKGDVLGCLLTSQGGHFLTVLHY
jgi:hypothetical protein